ncbi:DDE-type integrase/transposase/recombinase [Pontibacter sp. 172403-2]|uniref:DDE-type integrase/transposase/recombinase n=1 Tax=Pontibacter rufus TaxID=2791028 RepID=UPI0018AF712B|nr:DDE-type integrase/transposase/recombinase [Pontibacter sp. 172403-2]MBF9252167.1 DDE-type integrase/transposase/recombinase [Pontibacter sp. 172403-2]
MNKLPLQKRTQIINCLVEGMSLRATSRIADVSINTVTKLLVDVGRACQEFHDATVHGLTAKRIQCDEIWSFVYAKGKNVEDAVAAPDKAGDAWTWTAIDANSKLIVSWYVGNRDADSAYEFMKDVQGRLKNRVQLTTDGLKAYIEAVDKTFGIDIDFAQLVKIYGQPQGKENERRYSPADCTGAERKRVTGRPYPEHISTSYVERQNLTMRRFTRLTNAFSKKVENHCYAIALHFVYYNFIKIHKSLRVTPAMEAGLTKRLISIEDIVRLTD